MKGLDKTIAGVQEVNKKYEEYKECKKKELKESEWNIITFKFATMYQGIRIISIIYIYIYLPTPKIAFNQVMKAMAENLSQGLCGQPHLQEQKDAKFQPTKATPEEAA